MHTNDKTSAKQESAETFGSMSCPGMWPQMGMSGWCTGMAATDDCRPMMSRGMKACRWFPLIPIVAGFGLFILGYSLHTEIARVLCMVAGGGLALCGLLGLLLAGRMKRMCYG